MTLIDTSSWIEFLRGRESEPSQRVKSLLSRGNAALCEITMVELWNGVQGHIEKKALEELETEVQLYAINEQVWAKARLLARRTREKGITVPSVDIVITACAVNYGLELEHCDSHFEKILPIARKL
jgi:predicted nucleic acid-binding protein